MFRFEQGQVVVRISNISTCRVIQKSSNYLECIPLDADYPLDTDIPIMVKSAIGNTILDPFLLPKVELGRQRTMVGNIRFEGEEETGTLVVVIAVVVSVCVFILLVSIFVVILGCVWRNSRRKDQKLDELQMTLSKLETNVAHECKEG